MSCKDIEQKLSAYLEDALSPQEKILVEGHLVACPQCKKAMEDLEKTEMLIRKLEEVEPPPWFTQRIMARVREEAAQRESLFRKFFYPLHIKIPVQAFAMVLIAVLAFQIYRVGEPEMKVIVAPPATVFEARKEPTPAAPQKSHEYAPPPSGRGTTGPGETARQEKDIQAPHPFSGGRAPARVQETPVPHEVESPLQEPATAAKGKGITQDNAKGATRSALSATTREAPKALRAPVPEYKREESLSFTDTTGEKKSYEGAPAPPQMMGAVMAMPAHIRIAVHAKDTRAAAGEVESLLGTLDARKIQRQSREGGEVLTAVMPAQNIRHLRDKLKAVGNIDGKGIPSEMRGQDVVITIEVLSDY